MKGKIFCGLNFPSESRQAVSLLSMQIVVYTRVLIVSTRLVFVFANVKAHEKENRSAGRFYASCRQIMM
jgi:hypothetical protein